MKENVLESILDDFDLEKSYKMAGVISMLKIISDNIDVDPQPFKDCIGQDLKENDVVIYSDVDWGPRPGVVVKIDETGEFCAISYSGMEGDCYDMKGNIHCRDLVYKCLKIDENILNLIYDKL